MPPKPTALIFLQRIYHRQQLDIEHADIVVDRHAALEGHVVALIYRHDVPYACADIRAVIIDGGRTDRRERRIGVDKSVVFAPLLVNYIAALGRACISCCAPRRSR